VWRAERTDEVAFVGVVVLVVADRNGADDVDDVPVVALVGGGGIGGGIESGGIDGGIGSGVEGGRGCRTPLLACDCKGSAAAGVVGVVVLGVGAGAGIVVDVVVVDGTGVGVNLVNVVDIVVVVVVVGDLVEVRVRRQDQPG
jgi:hypothetical protein